MLDENIQSEANMEPEDTSSMYLEQIKKLKANTVSRDDYNRLLGENRNLLQTIIEGNDTNASAEAEVIKRPISEIKNDLFNKFNSNLDFVSKSLELRERIMEGGGKDPFLPSGHNVIPTEEDIAAANRVAQVFQECVNYADGDSAIFTNELYRRIV